MNKSESITALASALAKAQGAIEGEQHTIIPALANILRPRRKTNGSAGRTVTQRFFAMLAFGNTECWLFRGHIDAIGYGRFPAFGENKAHRVSWVLHNGPIPEGMKVLHKCDVRNCVNPSHLFLGTQADNVMDMCAKNRQVSPRRYGEKNPMSKLTAERVREIREIFAAGGVTQKALAEKFNSSPMTISRIVRGLSWNK